MFGVVQRDIRTVTGSNIALIRQETGLDPVLTCPWKVKLKLLENAARVPDFDKWSHASFLLTCGLWRCPSTL